MKTIRLIREVSGPDSNGPQNGQAALQAALREYAPPWLVVGGDLQPGEVPWYWCWADATEACVRAVRGEPFVMGPNIFFHNAARPGEVPQERILLEAPSCRLVFTESEWYATLIAKHLKSGAPIAVWPYPIEQNGKPHADPDKCTTDLLIYAKSGVDLQHLASLGRMWPHSRVIVYGHYRRAQLMVEALNARVCLYLSTTDRGPLALAEILLCGCPAVGLPQGAPWIEHGVNGAVVRSFDHDDIALGVAQALGCDRAVVAERAAEKFSGEAVVAKIVEQLERHVQEV